MSEGSLYNFNQEACDLLETFEEKVKAELAKSDVLHVDETGINKNGDRYWLHSASNSLWTHFFPHERPYHVPHLFLDKLFRDKKVIIC